MDGRREVTWTETFSRCAHLRSTLYVERWHGELYEDWIVGMPTMALAEIGINTAGIAFPYNEIVMTGDIIGSVGAGPQRVRESLIGFRLIHLIISRVQSIKRRIVSTITF